MRFIVEQSLSYKQIIYIYSYMLDIYKYLIHIFFVLAEATAPPLREI